MDETTLFLTVCVVIIIVLVIAIIIGSRNHVKNAPFKPEFRKDQNGNLIMEFLNFGGIQSERTKRFHDAYKVGMVITHENRSYEIVRLEQMTYETLAKKYNVKMVAYLQER